MSRRPDTGRMWSNEEYERYVLDEAIEQLIGSNPVVDPEIERLTAAALASKKAAHLGNFWSTLAPHMVAKINRDGRFTYLGGACNFAMGLGLGNPDYSNVSRVIQKHFPFWFIKGKTKDL